MSLHRDKQTDELFKSILSLESVEECYRYFEDLCTMKEIRDLGQRVAGEATGASSATIGRVKRCLNYGSGGYRLILDRMKKGGKADA